MENKDIMSGQESLQIIQQMIGQAKRQYSDDSFNYLLWGWLVFIASLGQYILAYVGFAQPAVVWLLMPVGAVISTIYNYKANKKETVKTYIDEFGKYVLIAFLVCMSIVLINQQKLGLNCYPMLIMIYGMWLFVSGGYLRFKPLIIGGICNWIIAIVATYVEFDIQLLLLALAVLVGYIIPGHMLSSHYKKNIQ